MTAAAISDAHAWGAVLVACLTLWLLLVLISAATLRGRR